VHRKRAPRRPQTISRVAALDYLNIPHDNVGPDDDLGQAARIIADGARDIARGWGSEKIPGSIYVTSDEHVATVHAAAPNARPAEFRLRHPLFGDRGHWYGPPGEPFLAPALDERIDDAMRRYANHIDRYAKKLGWK